MAFPPAQLLQGPDVDAELRGELFRGRRTALLGEIPFFLLPQAMQRSPDTDREPNEPALTRQGQVDLPVNPRRREGGALRRSVQSRFKKPDLVALGLTSPRERRSEPLFRQSQMIETAFASENLDEHLGEERHEGTDPRVPAAQVREAAAALRSTQDELYKIQRRYDEALLEKDELAREHDELFIYTARSFEADCRLAGFKELSRRVRPSESRPGTTEVEPDETGLPPVPEPGQDAPDLLSTPPVSGVPALKDAVERAASTPAESPSA